MIDGNDLIALLGKSERDEQIKKMFLDFDIKTPLPRPRKNDIDIHIELKKAGIEFLFRDAYALLKETENYAEGELIFNSVFFLRKSSGGSHVALPLGLDMGLSRARTHEIFGQPDWSSPVMNNDRWVIGKNRMLLVFDDEESKIKQIVFSANI